MNTIIVRNKEYDKYRLASNIMALAQFRLRDNQNDEVSVYLTRYRNVNDSCVRRSTLITTLLVVAIRVLHCQDDQQTAENVHEVNE